MRPNAFRTLAMAAAALAPLAAATPASAAAPCLTVTGTATTPQWEFGLWPGVSATPAPQSVSVEAVGEARLALTCALPDGATTYTGTLSFTGEAGGASIGDEDLTRGVGSAAGLAAAGTGVATLATAAGGPYGTTATATATVSFTYVRAGATISLVTTLGGLTVDVDGPGGIPAREWGDVPLAGAAPLLPEPAYVLSDYVYTGELWMRDFTVPPAAAVAAGT